MLNEKVSILLNINMEKYLYYFNNDIQWLLDNKSMIRKDFYDNYDKLKFYIILNSRFHNTLKKNEILKLKYSTIEEFVKYVEYIPYESLSRKDKYRIKKIFNKFKNFDSEHECYMYFETIKKRINE